MADAPIIVLLSDWSIITSCQPIVLHPEEINEDIYTVQSTEDKESPAPFILHTRKRMSTTAAGTSPKLQKTSSTTVTPLKTTQSATQPSPIQTKQTSSQKTPVRIKVCSVQAAPFVASKSVHAVPSVHSKSSSTTVLTKEKATQIQAPPMDIELSKHSDNDMKTYTGVNTYSLFNIIFNYMNSACQDDNCTVDSHKADPSSMFPGIKPENQFFLVLNKLWRNPSDQKLALEFGVSDATISKVFHFWNERMYRKFRILKICPSLETLQNSMTEYVKSKWPNLKEIYDGTEFKSQKPSDPVTQRQMWSSYKHDNTVKVQIGCSSTGAITSISDTYGGSISDKELFIKSNVLEHLTEGEAIMCDKGFLILDVLQGTGVELIRPPYLSHETQFDMDQRDTGREIAKARIVVENVNSRFKKFAILSKRINIKYLTIINEIVYNCCCLSNFGPPLRKS